MIIQTKTFSEGLNALCSASYSAEQAVCSGVALLGLGNMDIKTREGGEKADTFLLSATESLIAAALAANVISDRPTGNFVGWNRCSVEMSAFALAYRTCGGLSFGWAVEENGSYEFSLYRKGEQPNGGWYPESQLLESALAVGFKLEEFEQEYTGTEANHYGHD